MEGLCGLRETQWLHWKEQQGSSLRKKRKGGSHSWTLTYIFIYSQTPCLIAPQQPHRTLLEEASENVLLTSIRDLAPQNHGPPTLFFLPQTIPPAAVACFRPHGIHGDGEPCNQGSRPGARMRSRCVQTQEISSWDAGVASLRSSLHVLAHIACAAPTSATLEVVM